MQKDFRFSQEMKKEADLLNLNTITMDGHSQSSKHSNV